MTKARALRIGLLALPLLLLAGLAIAGIAWAGNSASYALDWQVLSGGGAPAESVSGQVSLNSSLGQTAIGHSAEGQVTLGAGYWYGLGMEDFQVFIPMILKGY